jgi:Xaa-Pro aminopeptidase
MTFLALYAALLAQSPLPPLREQAEIQQDWLRYRLENRLPALMRRHGVDMWLVISREYNEDPVFFSLVSPTTFAARRRTIYVFFDRGPEKGVERLALGGGSNGGLYTVYRDPDDANKELYLDRQWATLRQLIDQRSPKRIAIDISHTHAFADGLSAGEREQLEEAIGAENRKKLMRAENLPVEYISLRAPGMLAYYRPMMDWVHGMIARAFSREVVTPGKTTNQDVVWWMREEMRRAGFTTWFQPTVRVQKPAGEPVATAASLREEAPVTIERGDVLHCDVGITGMNLKTDTQHMGYVLRDGESEPPAGIAEALRTAQRMQDIVMEEMKPNLSGNAVLRASLRRIRAAGIKGTVYSHPIGDHGHGSGPLIGLWDRQDGVPGRGDVPLLPNTWFSIELSARTPVPEWGWRELWVGMEEDASLDEAGRMSWINRRQTSFHLVR